MRDKCETEDWPHITAENRAKLYAACIAAGTATEDKWLSEVALETIERLRTENAALRADDPVKRLVETHLSAEGRAAFCGLAGMPHP